MEDIQRVIEWPSTPSLNWYKGFLAGIYDAEGSYSESVLRIKNTDPVLIDWITWGFGKLGFRFTVESSENDRVKPLHSVRPLGGLRETLRFFHSIDPAIDRKRNIIGTALKSDAPLGVASIEPIGVRDLFDITTGTGDFIANGVVSHNCFARVTHWYLDQDGVNDWSSRIFVKVNAPEVLRRELARASWRREEVNIGTATDPYQAAEGKYRLTRQILEALRDFGTPAALITKSAMVVRDKDVLAQLARGPGATVCFSFTTVDDEIAREIEPDVPPPRRRMEAMRALVDAGISAGVILAPVLPGITDNEAHLTQVIQAAKDHGAQFLSANLLHLGDVVRQAYFQYLEKSHPDLIPEYERLYPKRYAPRADQQRIHDMVKAIKSRLNFDSSRTASTSRPHIEQKSIESTQISLL
jgi:DNA repair photolyase